MDTLGKVKYRNHRKAVRIISVAAVIAFFVVSTIQLWRPITRTFSDPKQFRGWVDRHGVWGRLVFVGMVMLQVLFALIPGEPLEVAAGYAFGTLEGTLLCLVGMALGSVMIFLFTRRFGLKMAEAIVGKEKIDSMWFMKSSNHLNHLVFFLFFIPVTPKDVITYFVGLTSIKLTTFLGLSSVARIPSIVTSAITGDALGVKNYRIALIVYAITGAISLIGVCLCKKHSGSRQKEVQEVQETRKAQEIQKEQEIQEETAQDRESESQE